MVFEVRLLGRALSLVLTCLVAVVAPFVALRQVLVGLMHAGLRPVGFPAVDASMAGQADLPPGCVVLSFDDALASQLRNALPVLTELNISAMFFVMPGFQDGVHQYMDDAGI